MPELLVKIGGNSSGFTKALNEAAKAGRSFSRDMSRTGSDIAKVFGGAFAGFSLQRMISGALAAGGNLQDLVDKTNVSAEALSKWGNAAQMAGSDANGVADSVVKLARQMQEAISKPAGETAEAFAAMGMSVEDLQTQSVEQTFAQIAEYVRTAKVDSKLISDIFKTLGRGGASMIPVFKQGLGTGVGMDAKVISDLDAIGDFITENAAILNKQISKLLAKLRGPLSWFDVTGKLAGRGSVTAQDRQEILKASETEARDASAKEPDAGMSFEKWMAQRQEASNLLKQAAQIEKETARAKLSSEERIAEMIQERAKLEGQLGNMAWKNTKEGAQIQLDIAKIDQEIAQEQERGDKQESARGRGFTIRGNEMTRIGGFSGGMNPGLVVSVIDRQKLTAMQTVAKNTGELVSIIRNNSNGGTGGGFDE